MKRNLNKITLIAIMLFTLLMPTLKVCAQSNPTTTGPIGSQLAYGINEDIKYWNGSVWVAIPSGMPGQDLMFINGIPTWISNPNGIITNQVTNIIGTTALSGGHISSSSGSPITARGVCWSINHNPTITDSHTSDDIGKGNFVSNVSGLILGKTYYVRAYATNSVGTVFGNEVSFITLAMPTISTFAVSSITSTSANSGGDVSSDGNAVVTVRGVCWSTATNPTTADSKTTIGAGTGSFSSAITGLSPGVTYNLRAYATNSIGTSYGNQFTFTTPAVLPTIYTSSITLFTSTTAKSGGNVYNNGGASITARGVCWSTQHNPSLTDNFTSDSIGVGTFTSTLTGLVRGLTYYARAYATNSVGTSYGFEYSIFMPVMDIDNNVYDTIKIGTQTWLKQNLKVTHYNNGDAIPNVTDNTAWSNTPSGAYCEYGAVATYGRLYNWYTVVDPRNLCPTGYHVPSNAEFTTLTTYLGGLTVAGGKLREAGTSHWQTPNTGATNSVGFTALPSGYRYSFGSFYGLQIGCIFWSTTEYDPGFQADYLSIFYSSASANSAKDEEHLGVSVRCLKD